MDPGNRTKGINGVLQYLSADPERAQISTVHPHYHSAPILVPVLQREIRCPTVTERCVCMCDGPCFIIRKLNLEQRTSGCRLRFWIIGCGLIIRLNCWQHRATRTWQITRPNCPSTHWITHTYTHIYSASTAFLLCARQSSIKLYFSALIWFSNSLSSIYVFQTLI